MNIYIYKYSKICKNDVLAHIVGWMIGKMMYCYCFPYCFGGVLGGLGDLGDYDLVDGESMS